MKIVDCVKLKEKERLEEEWSELRKEERERRRERKETKRNRQGCDSVFSACASFH